MNIKTGIMKTSDLKNLVAMSRMESKGYFKNSMEFAQKQYEIHAAEVNAAADKVYESYLLQGEDIARERRLIYVERNLKNISEFI